MVMPFGFFASKTATSNNSSIATTTGINGHQKYMVVNRPTCLDLPFPLCQRAVSTVLCVSTNRTESEISKRNL